MKKFPLEWLLVLKKNEVKEIEANISSINEKIMLVESSIIEKEQFVKELKNSLTFSGESWMIPIIQKSIKDTTGNIAELEKEKKYLYKEKDLIVERYKIKNKDYEVLKKQKKSFRASEIQKMNKIEEGRLNELSLLLKGVEDLNENS